MNPSRRSVAPVRKLVAAVVGTIAVFVMLFGLGMSSWAIVALGVAMLALAIGLAMVNVVRRGGRAWVAGTAHVVSASEPPASSAYGRCELQIVVAAPGLPTSAVKVRDPRVPVAKWPDAGATLPIMVAVDDMRHVRIQWEEVMTHTEAMEEPQAYADPMRDLPVDDLIPEPEPPPWVARDRQGWSRTGDDPGTVTADLSGPPGDLRERSGGVREAAGGPIVLEGTLVDADTRPSTLPRRPRPSPRPRPTSDLPPDAGDAGRASGGPGGGGASGGAESGGPESGGGAETPVPADDSAAPEHAGPENAGPGNAGPENADPENAGPGNAGPENADPENAASAGAAPDATANATAEPAVDLALDEPDGDGSTPDVLDERPLITGLDTEAGSVDAAATAAPAPAPAPAPAAAAPAKPATTTPPTDTAATDTPATEAAATNAAATEAAATGAAATGAAAADRVAMNGAEDDAADNRVDALITAYPSARPGPAGAIHGVGITVLVTDLDRSILFYRDLLGFFEIDSGGGSAVLASGDTRLVLRTVPELSPATGRLLHLNLEVGDVDGVYQELRAKGVSFVHGPRAVNRGDRLELWAAAFHDPDGHNVAVTQWRAVS